MKTLKDKNGTTLGTFLEQGDVSGGSGSASLCYIHVYCVLEGYAVEFTMQVDDNTLETYSDLYNYLVNKGLVITVNIAPSASVVGYAENIGTLIGIAVSTFEGDEYIGLSTINTPYSVQLFGDEEDFSITYLGQENNEE